MLFTLATLLNPAHAAKDEPPPDIINEHVKTGARNDEVAVIVGVENYLRIPKVPYAIRDVQAMNHFLLYTRGLQQHNIHMIQDGNKEMIEQAVKEAAAKANGNRIWFFYAGHGAADPKTSRRILLGDDTRSGDPELFISRAVVVDEIETTLSNDGQNEVVMMIDACYTGQGRTDEDLYAGKRFVVPDYAVNAASSVGQWAAVQKDEMSGPFERAQHGAFTYFAIGAMRGWADGVFGDDADGMVTAEEAGEYVRRQLQSVNLRNQHPVWVGDNPGSFVLSEGADEDRPTLKQLLGAEYNASGTAGGACEGIEGLMKCDAERSAQTKALQKEAKAEWAKIFGIASKEHSTLAVTAIRGFVEDWEDKQITVGGIAEEVRIGEATVAREWLNRIEGGYTSWNKKEVAHYKTPGKVRPSSSGKSPKPKPGPKPRRSRKGLNIDFDGDPFLDATLAVGPDFRVSSKDKTAFDFNLNGAFHLGDKTGWGIGPSLHYNTDREFGNNFWGFADLYFDFGEDEDIAQLFGGFHPAFSAAGFHAYHSGLQYRHQSDDNDSWAFWGLRLEHQGLMGLAAEHRIMLKFTAGFGAGDTLR